MTKLIKTYIRNILSEKKIKRPSAGIVVIKRCNDEWRFLGLKLYGKYDLPKGHIQSTDKNELSAAMREVEEETGITDLNFNWGLISITVKHVTLFMAQTDEDCIIKRNPDTNIYEHHGHKWVTYDEMLANVSRYLVPAVKWAKDVLDNDAQQR